MATRFPLSAFADEISPDLDEQIAALTKHEIGGLDLRGVDGKNVLELNPEELDRVKRKCAESGLIVECVGSPVNKIVYSPEVAGAEVHKLELSIKAAQRLGIRKIRIFSPQIPEGREEAMWPDVLAFMRDMADRARAADVVLMHENDARFIGAFPKWAEKLFDALGSPHFRAVYDFANGVPLGFRPMKGWFPWLLPHLESVHIKDAKADGSVMPAGEGEGQMRETLEYLIGEGWSGTLSLEPHLKAGGPYGGTTGPELFDVAVKALRKVVAQAGGEC